MTRAVAPSRDHLLILGGFGRATPFMLQRVGENRSEVGLSD